MIERYFIEGAKFAWTAPGAVSNVAKDGSINPTAVTASAMTFLDLDPTLFDTKQMNKFRNLGLAKTNPIPHDWLNYVHGQTATISTANDVLTGFMSGCIIVTYNDAAGVRQVGHIGTIDGAAKDQPPNSTVKSGFAAAMLGFTNVKGYKPLDAWDTNEMSARTSKFKNPPFGGRVRIVSLVTAGSQFFSILLLQRKYECERVYLRRDQALLWNGPEPFAASSGVNSAEFRGDSAPCHFNSRAHCLRYILSSAIFLCRKYMAQ